MIEKHTYGSITWIDIENPTTEDIDAVAVHGVVMSDALMNELLYPSQRGRIFKDGDAVCVTMHFPIMPYHQTHHHTEEIDFVITKETIITVRFGEITAFHDVKRKLAIAKDLERLPIKTGFDMFASLVSELYAVIDPELQKIDRFIIDIEKDIYEGKQRKAVEQISYTMKRILNFKRALNFHPDLFENYRSLFVKKTSKEAEAMADQLLHEVLRLIALLTEQKDTLDGLGETNKTLLSTHTNNVMKTFTILAFITFPLTLLVTVLSLNAAIHEFAKTNNGTIIIICGIIAVATGMMVYFKHKKWV